MAKKSQCEQCESYNPEGGLCRKNWSLPAFDDNECEYFGKDEPVDTTTQPTQETAIPQSEAATDFVSQQELQRGKRQRHGCATAWLIYLLVSYLYGFILKLSLSFSIIGFIISCVCILSVILMFKWNAWGLFIFFFVMIFSAIWSGFNLISLVGCLFSLVLTFVAFNMKANDGYTYFDHLGLTNKRKEI